jgi:hypothetical protein
MRILDALVGLAILGYVAWALWIGGEGAPAVRPSAAADTERIRIRFSGLGWTSAGLAFLAILVLVSRHFGGGESGPADALASKAEKIELVERMRSMIAEASDAESAAVMSVDAKDVQESVDRSRAALQETAKAKAALGPTLGDDGRAKKALSEFEASFAAFERIGRELGSLAPKNTNGEARELAFGPAAEAVDRMDEAGARIAKSASSPDAIRLALGAVVAARRVQVLLPLHIAEASDAGMDRIETRMAEANREAREDLAGLEALPGLANDGDLSGLASAYGSFGEIQSRILALSRENTNVHSLEIASVKMRAAKIRCQDALDELQRAIRDAQVKGVRPPPPFNPRRLRPEASTSQERS